MTVTGTNTFTRNKNQVIELSYGCIGALSEGQELTNFQITRASELLNLMLKSWMAKGYRLWKQSRGYLFVEPSVNEYILDGVTANATENYNATTLTVDAASGASTITVASTTGFVSGYNVGVVLNDNSIFWTTQNGAPVGNVITLTDVLPSEASQNNAVYVYQTKLGKLENIMNAQAQLNSTTKIPLQINSRDTYDSFSIPSLTGIQNKLYYNKLLDKGIIRLFPTPSTAGYIVEFTFQKQFFDMTNPLDSFDFPTEWLKAIYLNLAIDLHNFYPLLSDSEYQKLLNQADVALMELSAFDDENTSIYFQPASDQYRGEYA